MVKNDFVKKYFTCLSKIFVCFAFAFLLVFSFGQNDLKKSYAYNNDVSCYNNITDLTGSVWQFNSTLSYSQNINSTYNIDYTCSSSGSEFSCYSITFTYSFDYEILGRYSNNYLCIIYQGGWNGPTPETQIISINGGADSTNSALIDFLYSQASLISYNPVTKYNITINLDDGLYGSTSAQISEGEEISLTYSVLNNGVFGGYVFNYGDNLITRDSGHGHVSVTGNYEEITLIIYDVTEDLEFTIHSILGRSLVGDWYLDYSLFLSSDLESVDVADVLSRPFTSNDTEYNRIYRNTNFNSFVYDNTTDFELPSVNVFSFLNGLYLPVNTYNYLLIYVDYNENYANYVPADYMFFNFFRLATNEDRARVEQLNQHLITQKENTNFIALFGAILDAQFGTLKSLLNFYIFDINVWSLVTFFLTIILIFIVFKIIKGGSSDGKKS